MQLIRVVATLPFVSWGCFGFAFLSFNRKAPHVPYYNQASFTTTIKCHRPLNECLFSSKHLVISFQTFLPALSAPRLTIEIKTTTINSKKACREFVDFSPFILVILLMVHVRFSHLNFLHRNTIVLIYVQKCQVVASFISLSTSLRIKNRIDTRNCNVVVLLSRFKIMGSPKLRELFLVQCHTFR